jgi:hypothetical protein
MMMTRLTSRLAAFWKDLDDYANAGSSLDESRLANFDEESPRRILLGAAWPRP